MLKYVYHTMLRYLLPPTVNVGFFRALFNINPIKITPTVIQITLMVKKGYPGTANHANKRLIKQVRT